MFKRKYDLIAERYLVDRDLKKQNAIVDAVRNGKFTKAEILSDRELIPRDSVLQTLFRKDREDSEHRDKKVLDKLQAIADKPNFDRDEFLRDFDRILQQQRLKLEMPRAIEASLPDEGQVVEEAPDEQLVYPRIEPRKATIGERKYVEQPILSQRDIDRANDVEALRKHFDYGLKDYEKYFDRLNTGKRGQNLIAKQEEHQRNLENYIQYLRYLKQRINQLETQEGSSIMTTIHDLKERLQILIGEITSGNTSKALKNELADVLHYLLKKKVLSKERYMKLMNLTT